MSPEFERLLSRTSLRFGTKGDGTLLAVAPSGSRVEIVKDRSRYYPGLLGDAPNTLALYEMLGPVLATSKRLLDVGCGVGLGAELLRAFGHEVLAVDNNPAAVQLGSEVSPELDFGLADGTSYRGDDPFDAVVMVDVLGAQPSPLALLRNARSNVEVGGKLCVAEPRAFVAQSLKRPVRRAFSPRALEALLCASGFEVQRWLVEDGTFAICLARALPDDGEQALEAATYQLFSGNVTVALEHIARALQSARAGVRAEAKLMLAELHLARGEGDEACKIFLDLRESASSDPRALASLSHISLIMSQTDDALSLADVASNIDPCDVDVACVLAQALEASSSPATYAAWRRASNLAPDNLGVARRFAVVAGSENDHAAALFVLDRVRSYGDDHGAALPIAMCEALMAAGRLSDARLEWKDAQVLAPESEEVRELGTRLADA